MEPNPRKTATIRPLGKVDIAAASPGVPKSSGSVATCTMAIEANCSTGTFETGSARRANALR